MLAQPSSRLIFGIIPWYSFLIVSGMVLAIILAIREEKRLKLPADTILTLILWMIPISIIGARLYYVFFSWPQYASDPIRVLYIWEGGLAIYGGIIAGLITVAIYSKVKKISMLTICDLIAPGLALAQGIGRWGNYFNMEAYGLTVNNPSLQFFPFAVLINEGDARVWHMATFFYESVADILIGLFLLAFRRKMMKKTGDTFFWYVLLYGAARLITENFRMDSLYGGNFRISQVLSVVLCISVILHFTVRMCRKKKTLQQHKSWISLWTPIIVIFLLFLNMTLKGGNADPFPGYRYSTYFLYLILLTDMLMIIRFNKAKIKGLIAPVLLLMIAIFWFLLYSALTEESIITTASSAVLLILFSVCSVMTGGIVYHRATEEVSCR